MREPYAPFDEGRLGKEPRSRDRSACNEARGTAPDQGGHRAGLPLYSSAGGASVKGGRRGKGTIFTAVPNPSRNKKHERARDEEVRIEREHAPHSEVPLGMRS